MDGKGRSHVIHREGCFAEFIDKFDCEIDLD